VIHRDLKPSNIMIASDGRVKLLDFGIARPVDASIMTTDGAIMGTMQYLSPEQLAARNIDVRSDIYSLGSILYETITGEKAFPQTNLSKLMACKSKNEFLPFRFYKARIPRRLQRIIYKCMAHDADRRIQNAAALLAGLEAVLRELTPDTPEQVMAWLMAIKGEKAVLPIRKRHPRVAQAAVAAGGIIAIGAVIALLRALQPEQVAQAPAVKRAEPPGATASPPHKEQARATAAPASRVASRKAPVAAPDSLSYLEKEQLRLGIADPLELLKRESGEGNFAGVLQIYPLLSSGDAAQAAARLLRLRALSALGKDRDIESFFAQSTVEDGEFYLRRAQYLFGKNDIAGALQNLDQSAGTASVLMEADQLRRECLYWRALCGSKRFDGSPSTGAQKAALDSWFEVKNALRMSPEHPYFRKAVAEMQRINLAKSSLAGSAQ